MARQKAERKRRAQEANETPAEPATISGKLAILVIAGLAILAVGFSWWFRYTATHRSAAFWGPEAVVLIRDAPTVHWITLGAMDDGQPHEHNPNSPLADHYHTMGGVWRVAERREISQAPGLTHLRNELLMDRAFQRDEGVSPPVDKWQSGLEFRAPGSPPLVVFFTADYGRLMRYPPKSQSNVAQTSTRFASGLQAVFADWRELPAMSADSAAMPSVGR